MRISIDDENKTVALWLNNQENTETNLPQDTENIIEEYKRKKYKVCMYKSGKEDIRANLLQLILNNAS